MRAVPAVAGAFLLALNIYGLITFSPLEPPEEGIPGYDYPVRDVSELYEILESPPEIQTVEDLEEINTIVFESIFHTGRRKYSFSENYILFLGGFLHEYISSPQNPAGIIKGGGGLCSEISAVMKRVLRRAGVKARFIGLRGHVALEVEVDDEWVVADPDYGVVYEYPLQVLEERANEIIPGALAEAGYPDEMIEAVVRVFMDSEENVALPPGQALSPRLALIENAANVLKWVLPAGLLVFGMGGFRREGPRDEIPTFFPGDKGRRL